MSKYIDITFKGTKLEIKYEFIKGKGFIDHDTPPSEDEVNILDIKVLDGGEMPSDDISTRWTIEELILNKIT